MRALTMTLALAFALGCSGDGKPNPNRPTQETQRESISVAVELGKTKVRDVLHANAIGYYVAQQATLYVEDGNKERVLAAMKATPPKQGEPPGAFRIGVRNVEIATFKPWGELLRDSPVGEGDAVTTKDFVCTEQPPNSCLNRLAEAKPDAPFAFSFLTPAYGYSGCWASPGDTCVSWMAHDTVATFQQPQCAGPAVNKRIGCLVCSMP